MDTKKEKIQYFNAFVDGLLKRYEESYGSSIYNDLSKLKILKLLFLAVAKDEEALNIFNNFVAWDLGPVEKDIYDEIDSGCQNLMFNIDNKTTQKKYKFSNIDKKYTTFADERIDFLKHKNQSLIKRSASNLVDMTHKRDCWIIVRHLGLINKDKKIGKNIILMSNGYYY